MRLSKNNDIRNEKFLRETVVIYKGKYTHWIDALATYLDESLRKRDSKKTLVFNGGLSVSGLQHVGRLRGEIIIPDIVASLLERQGYSIEQYLTLYTQDAWKGKKSQLKVFQANSVDGTKYKGWPLIKVPDPYGEKNSWIERYWLDFGPYIEKFTSRKVRVVTTTELYRTKLKEFVKITMSKRSDVVQLINKYRGRKPYPVDWIPFEPICEKCGKIDSTRTIKIDVNNEVVEYECKCGHRGTTNLSNGKLNWRIEWVGIWWSLSVDFEPYGKDHAVPGGSRDSANELAEKIFNVKPPLGLPYEWVSLRQQDGSEADMSSSDFIGFTPKEWLEVAHPELLRFLVLRIPPMRKLVLSLYEIPRYYDLYYKAERVYYGVEEVSDHREKLALIKSYEYSYKNLNPPPKMPAQFPYLHIAILSQIIPREYWYIEAPRRLQKSGHLSGAPSKHDKDRLFTLMEKSWNWVNKYSPDHYRFEILREIPLSIKDKVPDEIKMLFKKLAAIFETLDEWKENNIKNVLIEFSRDWEKNQRQRFYKYFYLIITGREFGPRMAPLLALLGREFTIKRLIEVSS